MKRFFITGIGTNIGKTFISSLLFNSLDRNTCYYKPIQTGCKYVDGILKSPDVEFVKNNSTNAHSKNFTCSYSLEYAVSPHLSSRMTGIEINISKIKNDYITLQNKFKNIVIEGAGGIFTPINENNYFIIDLIKDLDLKTIIITNPKIGTINHTLMTFNHLKQNEIKISGIVFNRFKNTYVEKDNVNFIKNYTKIKNILLIPHMENFTNINDKTILNFISNI